MTRLFNNPTAFADELRAGFVAANGNYVRAVPGGVARSTASATGRVAVVIGGGSGHYPAFAGLVGPGLASGAAMGNLFASPSAKQIESVSRAIEQGGGVLLACGNYAGDVLNFTAAAEAMRADGIDVRTLWVTDDISSAPPSEHEKRRGVAGGLIVYKVAGAAAEEGASLDDVERIAAHANNRTRTLGVAFSGCTLPGAREPLFTIPEGRMAVGMGIHGEPGISELGVPTADGLAQLLVARLLEELPADVAGHAGRGVIAVLNGLGSVKYEELFVVYQSVSKLLEHAGVEVKFAEVGEFCTSFDMAGLSLTLCWLDQEIERLWAAPAATPSFRSGIISAAPRIETNEASSRQSSSNILAAAPEGSRLAAATAYAALTTAARTIDTNVEILGRMDAVAGDGDHGIGMQRGVHAAMEEAACAFKQGAGAGTTLRSAGDAWADRAGGTSGALWGIFLNAIGDALGDHVKPDITHVVAGVETGVALIRTAGGAAPGDKTMVDSLVPFAQILSARANEGLPTAWAAAAQAATEAAAASADLTPRLGRSRSHGKKSLGTPDPGAYSFALVMSAITTVLQEASQAKEKA